MLAKYFQKNNEEVFEKGQVKSTRNRLACMRNSMKMEEAKGVCKDRSKWKEVISAYPKGLFSQNIPKIAKVRMPFIVNLDRSSIKRCLPIAFRKKYL
jgi:hypothetical protein